MKVTTHQKEQLAAMAREVGAIFIVAFGSAVRGEARSDSDLDIAILMDKTPDYRLFGEAYNRVSDIFGGQNVDVRFLNDADPLFTMQVVRDGILLYGDQNAYDELKILTNRRFIDDGIKYFPMLDDLLNTQQKILQRSIT